MAAKSKKTKKSEPFVEMRLKMLEDDFNREAQFFQRMMEQGGGSKNIHMLGCVRQLQFLYLDIAAHMDAKRSLEGKVT